MKRASLRSRIVLGVGALQLGVACCAAWLVMRHSQRESLAAFDANLASHATSLLALVQAPEEAGGSLVLHREMLVLPSTDRYRLTDAQNHVIADTPDWQLPAPLPSGRRTTFPWQDHGTSYRALLLRDVALVDADADEEERRATQHVTLVYGAATTEMDIHLREVALATGLACLALLGFSLLVTVWIVRTGLHPLHALAAEASRLDADQWDFHPPARVAQVEELQPLSAALSHSLSRLKAAFERERQMLGDAAHELKTAVAIVKSTLQLALQAQRSREEYRQGLIRALEDTDRLEALVLRLLQLAEIESTPNRQREQTEVASALAGVIDQLAPVTQAREVSIETRDIEPHRVNLPEQYFVLLAANLIENAIQHSRPGQSVQVRAYRRNNRSELVVRDEGPGIPAEALPHLFERFFRTDQSRARTSGGFGLGLAIVHALTVKYGGTIAVQSVVGQGTVFTVCFPTCPVSPTEPTNLSSTRSAKAHRDKRAG